MYDVVGLNGLDYDIVLAVDHLPQHDEKLSVRLLGNYPGGPVGNFACAASRLGLRVAVAAELGEDVNANAILHELVTYAVSPDWIVQEKGKTTDFTVILVDPSGERAILVVQPDDEQQAGSNVEIPEVVYKTNYLYLTMHSFKQVFAHLPSIRESGVKVMIDIENTKATLDVPLMTILENCDIASFNRSGFTAFANREPHLALLDRLKASSNVETILVTMGKEGAMGVDRSQKAVHIPGIPVTVKDTTGAGDTFNAAFLASKLKGFSLLESLQFSIAASALSVTGYGPKGKLPTWGEVTTFLKPVVLDP